MISARKITLLVLLVPLTASIFLLSFARVQAQDYSMCIGFSADPDFVGYNTNPTITFTLEWNPMCGDPEDAGIAYGITTDQDGNIMNDSRDSGTTDFSIAANDIPHSWGYSYPFYLTLYDASDNPVYGLETSVFFQGPPPDYNSGNWGDGENDAGAIQTVPIGYGLTAIGYASDDHQCKIGIRTAPVNPDGSVDFSQTTGWQINDGFFPCEGTPTSDRWEYEKSWENPNNQILVGWSWGAENTSGGVPGNDSWPTWHCYYQEYMNLATKQVFGWGSQYDGTCNETAPADRNIGTITNLYGIIRAPVGHVIVALRFNLDNDAKLYQLGWTTRNVTNAPAPVPPGAFNQYAPTTACGGGSSTDPSITISWESSAGATNYDVYRDSGSGSVFYADVDMATTFTDNSSKGSFSSGTSYQYQIRASNTGGTTNSNSVTKVAPWCLGDIRVRATLDGAAWTGALNYTVNGPSVSLPGSTVNGDHNDQPWGIWNISLPASYGGPSGAAFLNITDGGGTQCSAVTPPTGGVCGQLLPGNTDPKPAIYFNINFANRNDAQFISQTVPTTMGAGQTYDVSVTMKNIGSTTWTAAQNYKLGSRNPADNTTWGFSRVNVPTTVAPGASVTYSFTVTAPSTPGSYNFQWGSLREGVEWFGELTTNVAVNVTGRPTCTSATPDGDTTTANSGTRRAYANGVSSDATSVRFPTWSVVNGQDDIIWYAGINDGGGTWHADANLADHPGPGLIGVHVYMYSTGFPSGTFCDSADFSRVLVPSVAIDEPAPSATVSGTINIGGWTIDNTTVAETAITAVKIYIDGTFVGNATYGASRTDVCTSSSGGGGAYPGRPGCPNVGYNFSWNSTSVANGAHTIRVDAIDSDATPHTGSGSRTITVSNVPSTFTLGAPTTACGGGSGTDPSISLSWGAPSSPAATSYTVFRTDVGARANVNLTTSFTDDSSKGPFASGANYTYFIRAYNSAGTRDSNSITLVSNWCVGDIRVKVFLNGTEWSGSFNSTVSGPSTLSGTAVRTNHNDQHWGWWFISLPASFGGPPGATFQNITDGGGTVCTTTAPPVGPTCPQLLPVNANPKPELYYNINFDSIPTVDLKATVWANWAGNGRDTPWVYDNSDGPIMSYSGANIKLSWTSTYATSCTLDGASIPNHGVALNGNENTYTIGNGTWSDTYVLSCTGPGGTTSNTVAFSIPPPPTNPAATCPNPGISATLSWTAPVGWTNFYVRFYDPSAGTYPSTHEDFAGTTYTLPNSYPGANNTVTNTTPGHEYSWWIHSRASNGAWSDGVGSGNFTCGVYGPPTVAIDEPPSAAVSGTIRISGWTIDNINAIETAISSVKIYIDNVFVANATYGLGRPDVCAPAAYPGRPGCPNVGYDFFWNSTTVTNGAHTLRVDATDSDSPVKTGSGTRNINVSNLPNPITLGAPTTACIGGSGTTPSIAFSWTSSTNADSYTVFRTDVGARANVNLSTSFTDDSSKGPFASGANYTYFIRAYNSAGFRDSNSITLVSNWCVGDITVRAFVGGTQWSGAMNSTVSGFSSLSGSAVPTPHNDQHWGFWQFSIPGSFGGPPNATFQNITDSGGIVCATTAPPVGPVCPQSFPANVNPKPALTYNVNFVANNFSISAIINGTLMQTFAITRSFTVTHIAGNLAPVSFVASGLPLGVTPGFSPSSCTPTAGSPCSVVLTLTASSSATPGTYTITVTGTSGTLTRTSSFTLVVNPTPPIAPSVVATDNAPCELIRYRWMDKATNEAGFRVYRSAPSVNPTIVENLSTFTLINGSAPAQVGTDTWSAWYTNLSAPGGGPNGLNRFHKCGLVGFAAGGGSATVFSGSALNQRCVPDMTLSTFTRLLINGQPFTNQVVEAGDVLTLRVTISNTGTAVATNVFVDYDNLKNIEYETGSVTATSPNSPSPTSGTDPVRFNASNNLGTKAIGGTPWYLDFNVTVDSQSIQAVDFYQGRVTIYYDGGSYTITGGPWIMKSGVARTPKF